jgi:hypothetical protein
VADKEIERIYVEVEPEMKRALEELVLHFRRRRQHNEPRNLSGVVRAALDEYLTHHLPGYSERTPADPNASASEM